MHLKFVIRYFLWVIPVLLGGCASQSSSPGLTPLPSMVKDIEPSRKALRQADQAFAKLAQKNGAAQAFYQFLAPGGTVLLPDAQPLEGREVVRVRLTAASETILDWETSGARISENGDLGYSWGTFESSTKAPEAKAQHTYSKYLSVWKKQPEGSWRIILHASNSSPPPNSRR